MPIDNARDPRQVLVRDKYFTLKPKPLERWLWQQGLPQAAERVFWLHWEEGMRRGDWCSELSLKQVARECCIDTSTVTRAYQVLKGLDLIRREDPGRDLSNPFQQAIAITEVRVPRDLLVNLVHAPNRPQRPRADAQGPGEPIVRAGDIIRPQDPIAAQKGSPAAAPPRARLSREESAAFLRKLSDTERAGFFLASRDRRTSMAFDENTALGPEERGRVLEILTQISAETPTAAKQPRRASMAAAPKDFAKPRKLSPLESARLRKRIGELVTSAAGAEVFRQVLWSVEEGALRRFDARLAANIALKKIREGAWTRPNRMPPNWLRRAAPETCSAA
jgi:hypothetical protein